MQFLILVLLLLFEGIAIPKLQNDAAYFSLDPELIKGNTFRSHELTTDLIQAMRKSEEPARIAGVYLLEQQFHPGQRDVFGSEDDLLRKTIPWQKSPAYSSYMAACEKIWSDVRYFPVMFWKEKPDLTVTFEDSWMSERTYGGKRGHEGTDLMASKNERGIFPIVSMTDGTVTSKGWLPKGGWRLGITSTHGGYFYYAHLDSYADVEVGDEVEAGDLIGYMGDSGYGKEGTTGQFPVHLHLGIYLEEPEEEISINPYWILKYAEGSQLFVTNPA
ncbi:M23 family metallopeptidase [Sellimonas intestinalis]|uniref:M23 family metallopeptidase n=1 Tax=Sellimonas intestinalis TaxID=1653434 RepID=UPI0039955FFC